MVTSLVCAANEAEPFRVLLPREGWERELLRSGRVGMSKLTHQVQ